MGLGDAAIGFLRNPAIHTALVLAVTAIGQLHRNFVEDGAPRCASECAAAVSRASLPLKCCLEPAHRAEVCPVPERGGLIAICIALGALSGSFIVLVGYLAYRLCWVREASVSVPAWEPVSSPVPAVAGKRRVGGGGTLRHLCVGAEFWE